VKKQKTDVGTAVFGEWPFFLTTITAIALIGPALVWMPEWRDVILGSASVVVILLLGVERIRARRRMLRLAAQIEAVATLDKLEITDHPAGAALDQALNAAIQRTREQAHSLQIAPHPAPSSAALHFIDNEGDVPRSLAVLALGLREPASGNVSPLAMEQLREIAGTVVRVAEARAALLQMQGSGTFVLIFAAFSHEPAARSATAAFEAALELRTAHPDLRFGISAGSGLPCELPGAGYTVIGSPLEEAIRLHRLAARWHEFQVLCPEPVALLLRPRTTSHRTSLQLTSPTAPALPVYALDLETEALALQA